MMLRNKVQMILMHTSVRRIHVQSTGYLQVQYGNGGHGSANAKSANILPNHRYLLTFAVSADRYETKPINRETGLLGKPRAQ